MSDRVQLRDEDGIAVVVLSHGRVNALDLELLTELADTVQDCADAHAVVLTGAGSSFSAGVDLRRVLEGGRAYLAEFLPALSRAFLTVLDLPRPVVAATNGHAIAGGCVLVEACDVRLMSGGRISLSELRVGVPLPVAATEIMRYRVPHQLHGLLMSGAAYGPAEAVTLGLVDQSCDPEALMGEALRHARELGALPRGTFATVKSQLLGPTRERITRLDPEWAPRVLDGWAAPAVLDAIAAQLASLGR